jgi:hypothetical protein
MKWPGMPLFTELDWKLYQCRSWRLYHVFMRKVSGRFMPSNSARGVLPPVLMWAPTPYPTIMDCILLLHLQWQLDCLHWFQMVSGSTTMDSWMEQLVHGLTIHKFRNYRFDNVKCWRSCSPYAAWWNLNMKGCSFFEFLAF